jgi:hypothetical protein
MEKEIKIYEEGLEGYSKAHIVFPLAVFANYFIFDSISSANRTSALGSKW